MTFADLVRGDSLLVDANGNQLMEQIQDMRQEAEKLAAQIDWSQARETHRPPQSWFDDEEDNPFEPEKEPSP